MTLACHYIDGSPFARMVRVLAREWSIAMEEIELTDFPPRPEFFRLNPLGQVPVLMRDGTAFFPTEVALSALIEEIADNRKRERQHAACHDLGRRQHLAVVLAFGEQLAALRYRGWAGLVTAGPNQLGFDLDARAKERIAATLDWLEECATDPGADGADPDIVDVALACLLLWSESRGPIPWRGRPRTEALVARMAERQSFKDTAPRPWAG